MRKLVSIISRWIFFGLFVGMLLPGVGREFRWLPASLSPYVGISAAISTREITALFWICLPVLVSIVVVPHFFCRYVCPTGLILDLLDRFRISRSSKNPRWPMGQWLLLITVGGALFGYPVFLFLDPMALFTNGIASLRAPMTVISLSAVVVWMGLLLISVLRPKLYCASLCPLGELQLWMTRLRRFATSKFTANSGSNVAIVSRRHFLASVTTGAVAGAVTRLTHAENTPPLRPPGALPDPEMSAVCVRCGNCMRVCPEKIVQPAIWEAGFLNFLTPVLRFDPGHCRPECTACGAVCPSGALSRLSVQEKKKAPVGLAVFQKVHCIRPDAPECCDCFLACPEEALEEEWDAQAEVSLPSVVADKCTGCGLCAVVCPALPKALSMVPVPLKR